MVDNESDMAPRPLSGLSLQCQNPQQVGFDSLRSFLDYFHVYRVLVLDKVGHTHAIDRQRTGKSKTIEILREALK